MHLSHGWLLLSQPGALSSCSGGRQPPSALGGVSEFSRPPVRRNVSNGIAPIAEVTTEELKEQIIEIKSSPTKRGTGL